jgi:hypothetical protein
VPHIPQKTRPPIAVNIPSGLTAGELNFMISDIVDQWLGPNLSYDKINSAIGVLECGKLELYRCLAGPYEDSKIESNGSVYMERD